MATTAANPPDAPATEPDGNDAFHRLHKMSTTAGVGAGDYVAINGLAIATVLVGIASALALFDKPFLLLVPLAGVVCAVLAWVQIGHSNGTQTGRGLAVLGLLLSLGLGASQGGKTFVAWQRSRSAEAHVIAQIHDFGQDIVAGRFPEAYARCGQTFQEQFSLATFQGTWSAIRNNTRFGKLTGIEWNGLLQFETDPIRNEPVSGGMVLLNFDKSTDPLRTDMFFREVDGTWKIERIPQFFALPTAPTTPRAGRPAAPQVMGPPKPV